MGFHITYKDAKTHDVKHSTYHALLNDKAELSTDSGLGGTDSEQEIESDLEIEGDGPQEQSPSVVPVFGPAILDAHASEPVREFSMHIDVAGDFYGDNKDYMMGDFGLVEEGDNAGVGDGGESDRDSDSEGDRDSDSEEVNDIDIDARDAEDEVGLEPERNESEQAKSIESEDEDRCTNSEPALRLRGGEQEPLQNHPFIVQFLGNSAGTVHSRRDTDQNGEYSEAMGSEDNQFTPFSSHMEWEIARWAKLRGPSSMAFNELMVIKGVSHPITKGLWMDSHYTSDCRNPWTDLQELYQTQQSDWQLTTWTTCIQAPWGHGWIRGLQSVLLRHRCLH